MPMKGMLISTVLTNHADVEVQISLALCVPELIHITALNPPFQAELM